MTTKTTTATASFEPYVGIDEAAAHLGLCTKTIRRYVAQRIVKAYKFGGSNSPYKFKLSELEEAATGLGAAYKSA